MTCANCQREAFYTYKVAGSHTINYCQMHLPRFLFAQRDAGLLKLDLPEPETSTIVEPTPVKTSKKKVATTKVPTDEVPVEDAIN